MSNTIDNAIRNALLVNMGWKKGESVVIIAQQANESFSEEARTAIKTSLELAQQMYTVLRAEIGQHVTFLDYIIAEARHGVDAPQNLYDRVGNPAVVFMPTAYSLTHTAFRKHLTSQGARIASMPTFTLPMFDEYGPMNVDYTRIAQDTKDVAERLRASRFVRVTGTGTDITVEIDQSLVLESDGLMTKLGEYGNLPGAEAFAVPMHKGKSNGYITIPAGFGGQFALAQPMRLTVENGLFTGIESNIESDHQKVENIIFGGDGYNVLAELGIGTNPKLTTEYIKRNGWSVLLAEKIAGSAHFANGNSKGMGGQNDVPVHIDWVVPNVKIEYQFNP